jgi:hypothetical protein
VSECFRGGEIFVEVLLGTGGSHSREVWIDPAVEQRKGGEPDHQEREQDPSPSAAEKSNASRAPSGLLPAHHAGCPLQSSFDSMERSWRGVAVTFPIISGSARFVSKHCRTAEDPSFVTKMASLQPRRGGKDG